MAASRYRIVLRGRLSKRFESAFDGMALEHGPNRTILVGDIRDQAQLYGLIGRLQEFGIELLAVEPANVSEGGSEPGAGPVVCGLPARQPVLVMKTGTSHCGAARTRAKKRRAGCRLAWPTSTTISAWPARRATTRTRTSGSGPAHRSNSRSGCWLSESPARRMTPPRGWPARTGGRVWALTQAVPLARRAADPRAQSWHDEALTTAQRSGMRSLVRDLLRPGD